MDPAAVYELEGTTRIRSHPSVEAKMALAGGKRMTSHGGDSSRQPQLNYNLSSFNNTNLSSGAIGQNFRKGLTA